MQGPGLFGEGENFLGEPLDKVDEMGTCFSCYELLLLTWMLIPIVT